MIFRWQMQRRDGQAKTRPLLYSWPRTKEPALQQIAYQSIKTLGPIAHLTSGKDRWVSCAKSLSSLVLL